MARVLHDRAHRLATDVCLQAAPWAIPFAELDDQCVLGGARRALILDPVLSLDSIINEVLSGRFDAIYPASLLQWDAPMFRSLFDGKGALGLAPTRRAFGSVRMGL